MVKNGKACLPVAESHSAKKVSIPGAPITKATMAPKPAGMKQAK